MTKSMLASQSFGKVNKDANFAASSAAKDAIAKYGKEAVVDATLGVIYDEKLEFATLKTAEEVYRSLPAQELMAYAPISGLPAFREAAIEFCFQGHQPKGSYASAAATPGGTGGLHHVIMNYVERGEKYLIPDWHWGPYTTMGKEMGAEAVEYSLFDEKGLFNLNGINEKIDELVKCQTNTVVFFNTPAHNPTGYSLSKEDWKGITDHLRELARDESKKLIVLWDMAYTDYAGDPDEVREFLSCFDDMPENMLLMIAFSMSKSFLIYGMRSGALICCSSSKDVIAEFDGATAFSNRNTWSNGSRGAQALLAKIVGDPELRRKSDEERKAFRDMLIARGKQFNIEAEEAGLKTLPYKAGFFLVVPTDKPKELAERLYAENIFCATQGKGIRFTLSAVPSWQLRGVPAKIAKAINEI